MMIQSEGKQYRISSPLLLLFSASFLVWQMGILYFAGNAMSLFGRTPIALNEQAAAAVIAAGYIASILFLCLFPRKAVLAERVLLPLALAATALMLFPLPAASVSALFYLAALICVFSIGVMGSVAAQHFTVDTTWRNGILCTVVGGVLIAVLQNDLVKMDSTVFVVFSILLIAGFTAFFYLIPAQIEVPYARRENGEKTHRMPVILFVGLFLLVAFSTLLLCFATAYVESFANGVSILYLSAAVMALLLSFLKKKLGGRSIRVYGGFFMISVFGFVLALVSFSVPLLKFVAAVLLAFVVALENMWIYFSAVAFSFYPTRFIGVIVAGQGLLLALLHAGLLELLRDNLTLLYGIYAAISAILMLTYYFLEPYFIYAWNTRNASEGVITAAVSETSEVSPPPDQDPLEALSEQERNVAELILAGYSGTSIAAQMNITMNTQKSYRKNLYAKLDIHSKRELFEIANKGKQ